MSTASGSIEGAVAFDPARRPRGVVVGFDGSDHATHALHFAAREARRRGARLTVVTVYRPSAMVYTTLSAIPEHSEDEVKKKQAHALLEEAREQLEGFPGEVDCRAERGDSTGELAEMSAEAQVVVVGSRGRGGFLGLVLGSVASALPAHASCPTIVVPATSSENTGEGEDRFAPVESGGPVLVGVDGSPQSRVAALQAAQVAEERGARLELLMALPSLDDASAWNLGMTPLPAEEQRRASIQQTLDAEIRWLTGHHPGLEVTGTLGSGDPATLLAAKTADAQLTVVGTRGRGAVVGTLLGSTSRAVLHHADGAVMVVPALEDERITQ